MANILAVAGPGSKYAVAGASGAGFWAGLWHGLICPITFIVSLFSPNVRIYDVNSRRRWYDFGFIIGVSGALGGGGRAVVMTRPGKRMQQTVRPDDVCAVEATHVG